jgi:hypothetical protein
MVGLDDSRIDFDDDVISVNFQGLPGAPNLIAELILDAAPVPARAAVLLLGSADVRLRLMRVRRDN